MRNQNSLELGEFHSDLKEQICYEPETGLFRWLRNGHGVKRGEIAGCDQGRGYLSIRFRYRIYLAHRLAWFYVHGVWPKGQIDHLNGIRSDNRISNLRDVSSLINNQNRRTASITNNSTGVLGVYPGCKKGTFRARIRINGKVVSIGTFESVEEAHAAYVTAKRLNHPGCTI